MTKSAMGICDGIAGIVKLLNEHGFTTVDSGDGSHHAAGMEGAMDVPMVAVQVDPDLPLQFHAHRIFDLFNAKGLDAIVEASYSPKDGIAIIMAYGEGLRNYGDTP